MRGEIDLLSAIALGGHYINVLRTGGGFYIQPGTPPEIAIADVVHLTVFGDRCAHPRLGDDLLPVPAAAIREKNAKLDAKISEYAAGFSPDFSYTAEDALRRPSKFTNDS